MTENKFLWRITLLASVGIAACFLCVAAMALLGYELNVYTDPVGFHKKASTNLTMQQRMTSICAAKQSNFVWVKSIQATTQNTDCSSVCASSGYGNGGCFGSIFWRAGNPNDPKSSHAKNDIYPYSKCDEKLSNDHAEYRGEMHCCCT